MKEEVRRIPYPCHPQDAWLLPDAKTTPLVYKQCPCCKRVYEVDTTARTMRQMIPLETAPAGRQLLEHIRNVPDRGDDVVIRRNGKQGIKGRGTRGYNEWADSTI